MYYLHDVIFVGSKGYHPEHWYRPALIEWLEKTYKDRFARYGGDSSNGVVRGHRLNRLYASTRVAVGDTLCINFDYPWYLSDRIFESVGRGAFTIFPYIYGLETFFEIDKEIVTYTFNDFEELKSKIDYYIEHDEEREKIRKAGHERVKREHTYMHRWEQILKEI